MASPVRRSRRLAGQDSGVKFSKESDVYDPVVSKSAINDDDTNSNQKSSNTATMQTFIIYGLIVNYALCYQLQDLNLDQIFTPI